MAAIPAVGAAGTRRRWVVAAVVLSVVLLLWNNVVITRTPGYPESYVPVNVAATAALLALARGSGLSWDELGLSRARLAAGLRWGGLCFAVVAAGYALALVVPATRPLLTDARTEDLTVAEVAGQVLFRIPFGTVLLEEIAFRGVLLAVLLRVLSVRAAAGAAAAAFGLWHVRPAISGLSANEWVEGPVLGVLAVVAVCVGTAAAGLLFTWLRLRSGSLLAPVLLHLATNTLGTVAAVVAYRLG